MARKFGSATGNRVSTGKIDQAESNTEKWAGSVAAQVATAASIKAIVAKTIPVSYIVCDPENPRKLALTQAQVVEIASKHPLDQKVLDVEESTDWIEDYVTKVAATMQFTGKAVGDLASLVGFASSLKSADRLLHPIVVWRDETTFHLIAGERRLLAHLLLGETHIAARILDHQYSRHQIDTLQWEENVHRQDMSLWERIEHVKKLISADKGIDNTSVTKLSKILGRSRAESQRYLAVLRYPDNLLMDAVRTGKVSDLKSAAALAQLPVAQLRLKLDGSKPQTTAKTRIKLGNKSQVSCMGDLLKAAAKQLKLESVLQSLNLGKTEDINEAVNRLIAAIEAGKRD